MKHPIAPMLCGWQDAPTDGAPFKSQPGMAYEIKWDGYRLIAAKVGDSIRLYLRSGRFVTDEYPEIVASLRQIPIDVVLDGEILVMRDGVASFQDLQNRMRLPRSRRAADLKFMTYDVLSFGALDTTKYAYVARREVLGKIVAMAGEAVTIGESSTDGAYMWKQVLDGKLEGLIAKPLASKYVAGNAGRTVWTKIKRLVREEFTVLGYTKGLGKRDGFFGALLIGQKDEAGAMQLVGKVGTGFTDAVLRDLTDKMLPLEQDNGHWPARVVQQLIGSEQVVWVRAELRGTVEFAERSDNGTPRMPSWKGLVS